MESQKNCQVVKDVYRKLSKCHHGSCEPGKLWRLFGVREWESLVVSGYLAFVEGIQKISGALDELIERESATLTYVSHTLASLYL